jgi:hypothetical protein
MTKLNEKAFTTLYGAVENEAVASNLPSCLTPDT